MQIPPKLMDHINQIQIQPDETPEQSKKTTAEDWIAWLKAQPDGELIRGHKTLDVLHNLSDVIVKIRDTWDSPKGWFFRGCYGCGKTRLLQTISFFKPLWIIDSKTIEDNVNANGYVTGYYTGETAFIGETGECVLTIEDLGRETDLCQVWVNGALKKINVGSEIIYRRYQNKRKINLTSNYVDAYIEGKYGGEILSRMKEMFHEINFPNKDYRKSGGR